MIELGTFGGAVLTRDGEPLAGKAVQRRRLALLAVLACAGARGVSRDKLVALLWPEQESESARHALSQWLFLLRRDLQTPDLVTGSSDLRLNPERIVADVMRFDEAIARRDVRAAAELYTGPFFDGFHLDDAPEFERWIDAERARREHEALDAMETVARDAEARGDVAHAIALLRRIVALDPLSGRAAANLMRALAAAGDTAAALQHARSHERAVREELEESPSPEVADLAMKLRTATAAPSPRAPSVARDGAANAEPYLAFVRERLMSRYAVHRIVGRTSLVTIFDATGARDDAPVMLRVIVPDLLSRADTTRLVAGLEAAARPRGEHIAPIGDVGVLGGLVFTATSPLVAPALRERLEVERHLKIDAALDIAIAVAAALACGDSHGIPHLDLTPRRILLDSQTRLADLGLMHAVVGSLTHNPAESGAALGTPAYLSPEQLAGEAVNGSLSDIYSLGCILYQMLAGEPPHSSTNTRALVARRLGHEPPRVRELRESVPAALDGLVARMVARIPADRVPSASALHEELRAIRATAGRD